MTKSPTQPGGAPAIQDYTGLAETYDSHRYVADVDVAHEARRRAVLTRLLPRHAARAADIACGTGRGLGVLQTVATTVVGVDGTLAMLRVAREKLGPAARVTQANAARLPFADGTFDLVICLNFLHLFGTVGEKKAFVSEMGRIVKPGGILIAEFDNALQGLLLGGLRKHFGRDIGYDWPWQILRCFDGGIFTSPELEGANLPFVWRIPLVRHLDKFTNRFPLNYLATRAFVRVRRLPQPQS
jgi:ubiquinone/menaquinone biosynthesis C-methylase UbiE